MTIARLRGSASLLSLSVFFTLFLFATIARATPAYTIVDLGALFPAGVNDHGQVVGGGSTGAELWSGGMLVSINPFGVHVNNYIPGTFFTSSPSGINNSEQIVLYANDSNRFAGGACGGYADMIARLENGRLTCLVSTDSYTDYAVPGGMNNAGKVAVWLENPNDDQPYPYNGAGYFAPPLTQVFFGRSRANDINDLNQVVGWNTGHIQFEPQQAVIWNNGVMTDLGSFGSWYDNEATEISNGGHVIGRAGLPAGGVTSFFWQNGVMTDIGPLIGEDVNGSGQVVGKLDSGGGDRAVIWESGVTTDLNNQIAPASGWVLQYASRITDNGYIIGRGTLNGQTRGYMLVPTSITRGQANLAVSVTPATTPGAPDHYVTVVNNGPDAATRVSVLIPEVPDFFPDDGVYTVNSLSPSQGVCNRSSRSDAVTNEPASYWCAIGTLAVGASATVTVDLGGSENSGALFDVTAHAIEDDTNLADNSATASPRVDLRIELVTDQPDPVVVGGTITYGVYFTNWGPNTATGITVSGIPGCTVSRPASPLGGGGSCTTSVVADSVGTLTKTITVSANEMDIVPGDNTTTVTTTVIESASADLAVSLSDTPDPVLQGGTVTYTATVTNNGPSTATNVALSGLAGCTLPVSTLASGASTQCSAGVAANSAGTLSHSVSVSGSESDPNAANNSATATTTVNPVADLAVLITDTPDPVLQGGTVTYTVTVANNGPSMATGVALTGLAGCTPPVSTLASGASTQCSASVTANTAGTLNQSVSVSGNEADLNAANNSATATTTVTPVANLGVTLSDSVDPVKTETAFSYTATVSNAGPSAASGISATVTLPAGLSGTASPSQGSCTGTGVISCSLGALASGASTTIAVSTAASPEGVFDATTTLSQAVTATAAVAANETDPVSANNSASASTTIQLACKGQLVTIRGTALDNGTSSKKFKGTSGNDVMHGLSGGDWMDGSGGADVICGGRGDDNLYGGGSHDKLYGDAGDDKLDGGSGTDICDGGENLDTAKACETKVNIP